MSAVRHVAVIDIGKSNAKLALVDLVAGAEIATLRQPNLALPGPPYPHHDVDSLWTFILDGLAGLRSEHRIDAISVTTHGATATLIDDAGELALPVLDYEFDGPDELRAAYDEVRPDFAETGSPSLPIGLNLGAQLFWQRHCWPGAFARATAILTWPQYWTWRLTGVMASEATSLGCHTDLWNPHAGAFSTLVEAMTWRGLFPPLARPGDVLGPVLPAIAARTGLDPTTPVVCGIHDSNASLLPHLLGREPPFVVVSTGTWVIAMALGGRTTDLDPARDTLVNVNALGQAVPSARFMGGREYEMMMEGHDRHSAPADLSTILGSGIMLMPAVASGSGPFPDARARWIGAEPAGGMRHAAVSLYLALMTATCLDLVAAEGEILVEGPFASNEPYLAMLEAATGRPVITSGGRGAGTSIGAAMLARPSGADIAHGVADHPREDLLLVRYARRWRKAAKGA